MDLVSKSVLIVGSGVSGMSALNVLEKKGAVCTVCDGREAVPDGMEYDLIVVSPGVPVGSAVFDFAKEHNVKLIGELELGWLLNEERDVIAVTGTNGKTTVTELVGNIVTRVKPTAVCGNIGIPFSSCANRGDYEAAVVEVSSFQLETTDSFRPHIACITNIACDHLDRHGTLENYAELKLGIARNQTENDFLVLATDEIDARYLRNFSPKSQVFFTALDRKVDGAYRLDGKLMFGDEYIMDREELPLRGDFNVRNALSAICICRLYGIPKNIIAEELRRFKTDAHRLEKVMELNGKTYWDDSKGTNIAAALQACKAMKGDTVVIMGGSDKGYDYDLFFESIPPTVKEIALIGETADKIEYSAVKYGFDKTVRCATLEDAVGYCAKRKVENVLLSPASASFDMFENYKKRGEAFVKAVKELGE